MERKVVRKKREGKKGSEKVGFFFSPVWI